MAFGKRPLNKKTFGGAERRKSVRRPANCRGEIIVPGMPPRRCDVVDISESGAKLSLNTVFGIASQFELRIGGATYRARVVRRGTGTLHVVF